MFKLIKKSLRILLNNHIFIQPPLILLLITTGVLSYCSVKLILPVPAMVLLAISILLAVCAFCAGWFYINKLGIIEYNEEDTREEATIKAVKNFKKFFEGTGSCFLNTLMLSAASVLVFLAAGFAVSKVLVHYCGIPGFMYDLKTIANMSTVNDMMNYINNIPYKDKLSFLCWMFCANILVAIWNYFTCLVFASQMFDNKNVFVTLWNAVKFFFKNILGGIFIMIFLHIIYIILNLLSLIMLPGSISFAIFMILFVLYLNYYLILIFDYYYEKTNNNGNNGTEFVG